jgi:hypothetical protein
MTLRRTNMADLSRQVLENALNHYASLKEDIKRAYEVCRSHEDKIKRLQAELESSKRDLTLSTQILEDLQKNRARVLEKFVSYVGLNGCAYAEDSSLNRLAQVLKLALDDCQAVDVPRMSHWGEVQSTLRTALHMVDGLKKTEFTRIAEAAGPLPTPTPAVSPEEDSVDRGLWPFIARLEDELWMVREADENQTDIEVFDDGDKAEEFLRDLLVKRGLIPDPHQPKTTTIQLDRWEKALIWRGSASDLATDIMKDVPLGKVEILLRELTERLASRRPKMDSEPVLTDAP